ncbi:unnamed protein product [Pleuronectes platessa]|uniref:Uncharacterized protein n=1 Tax=Pleuronectes platessa TaxID=8262 RepID=A0A9N7TVP1_PLEPL|nr:unnamed protein product [Pleuronectes platessa]
MSSWANHRVDNVVIAFQRVLKTQTLHPPLYWHSGSSTMKHFVILRGAIQDSASCPRTLRHVDGSDWGSNSRPSVTVSGKENPDSSKTIAWGEITIIEDICSNPVAQ